MQTDVYLELWRALGQVVPHVESPDTLGTIIATALCEMIGAGQAAVILRSQRLQTRSTTQPPQAANYFLRLVDRGSTPSHPIYLGGQEGILAELPNLKEPLYLSAPWPAQYASADDELLRLVQERLVVVPIPGAGWSAYGAICLLDVPPADSPSLVELAALASFTGVALNLLESKAQAARQAVEYNIISKIGHSLTSSLSLDEIFKEVLSGVREAIDAAEVSVGLIDYQAKEIVFEKSLMGSWFTSMPPIRLKLGQGVAGWVAKTGRPVKASDAYADPRFYSEVDVASGFVTRSILCVPLMVEGEVIGILEAVNKRTGHFSDADQRLLSALGASAAIAIEKARLHANVLAEKRRMEAIFATVSEGLLTVTLDGRITAVNPALQTMLGMDEARLLGRYAYQVIHTEPDSLCGMLEQIAAGGGRKGAAHIACDILRPEGRRVSVLVSGAATLDATSSPSEAVIVFSNISQLREVERMKDDFVVNVTHELRTPLATILLYTRLLRSNKAKGDPEREARYLDIVEQQSNQLQQLVRKILDLSRMGAMLTNVGEEHIQLQNLLDELLPPLKKIANQRGLLVECSVPPDLPAVVSNQEALRLVLKNLVDNAIKFTPKGKISVSARQRGQQIQVDICDEGIGIAPESIPHIFQRFYRTRAAVELGIGGTGLGLSLVKETVEKLGGEVQVRSQAGRGSTFSVLLPTDVMSVPRL